MTDLRNQRLRILADPMEKELLGVTPEGAEVVVCKIAQALVLHARIVFEIELAQHALHPDVDGKSFRAAIGKEKDAVGDLFSHALDFLKFGTGGISWHVGNPFQRHFAGGNLARGDEEMPGAKSEAAGAKLRFRGESDTGRFGKGMKTFPDLLPEGAPQFMVDLFDLHDLFKGRADEIAERLPWFLPEDSQARGKGLRPLQEGIIRKRGENFA